MGRRPGRIIPWPDDCPPAVALLGIVAVAFGLRVYHLADANIWFDEGFSWLLASAGPFAAATQTLHDTHPPLFYWLLWVWSLVAGSEAFALRFLSVAAGVLAVPVFYQAGRWLAGPWFGIAIAALLATSRFAIEWSQQVRMYEPALLLVVLVFALWWRTLTRPEPRQRLWIGYGLTVAAIGYTLYLALFVPSLLAAAGILSAWRGRLPAGYWRGWILAHGLAALLLVPWFLLVIVAGSRPALSSIARPAAVAFFEAAVSTILLGVSSDLGRVKVLAVALFGFAAAGFALAGRDPRLRPAVFAAALAAWLPLVLLFVLSRPNPVLFLPNLFVRYLVIFLPFYLLGLVWAAAAVGRAVKPAGVLLVVGWLALTGWTLRDYYQGRYLSDDYQSIVKVIEAYSRPGDRIVLYSDKEYPVFLAHYQGNLPIHRLGTENKLTPELAAGQASAIFGAGSPAWVVTVDEGKDADPDGNFRGWLREHARDLFFAQVDNRSVNLYSLDPAERRVVVQHFSPDERPRIPLSDTWEVIGYDQPLRRVARGDALRVGLYLRALRPAGEAPVLEVELVDAVGTPYRAIRQPLVGDWFAPFEAGRVVRGSYELRISDGIPGGDYSVRVGLVNPNDPAPVDHRLGRVTVLSDDGPGPQPRPTVTIEQPAADGIWLAGRDGLGAPVAGAAVAPTLYWRVSRATPLTLQSYLRLIGLDRGPSPGNPLWAARYQPDPGGRPTPDWAPNEVIREEARLELPADLPPGRYRLEAGLFDPAARQDQGAPVVLWEGTIGSP